MLGQSLIQDESDYRAGDSPVTSLLKSLFGSRETPEALNPEALRLLAEQISEAGGDFLNLSPEVKASASKFASAQALKEPWIDPTTVGTATAGASFYQAARAAAPILNSVLRAFSHGAIAGGADYPVGLLTQAAEDLHPALAIPASLAFGVASGLSLEKRAQQLGDRVPDILSQVGALGRQGKNALSKAATRGHIQAELAARGPAEADDPVGKILRGSWFHGGDPQYFPRAGETFSTEYGRRIGNLGEPLGISLTADPRMYWNHFAIPTKERTYRAAEKLLDMKDLISKEYKSHDAIWLDATGVSVREKATWSPELKQFYTDTKLERAKLFKQYQLLDAKFDELHSPAFSRVLPEFGGPPESSILKTIKGQSPDNKLLVKAYNEAYMETAPMLREELSSKRTKDMAFEHLSYFAKGLKENSKYPGLQEASWKAHIGEIQYNPLYVKVAKKLRSGELTPEQFFTAIDPQANPLFLKDLPPIMRALRTVAVSTKSSYPRTVDELERSLQYGKREFNESMRRTLRNAGKQGILYGPHRYNEYELLMFDPTDVRLLDYQRGGTPQMRRYNRKRENLIDEFYLKGQENYVESLREIYERFVSLPELARTKAERNF